LPIGYPLDAIGGETLGATGPPNAAAVLGRRQRNVPKADSRLTALVVVEANVVLGQEIGAVVTRTDSVAT
jgi:hypothetical protein